MAATLIDGKSVAQQVREKCRIRAEALRARGIVPGLAVVMAGENPASGAYVASKARACSELGMHSEVHRLPGDVTADVVLASIDRLNRDPGIHGIIVQLPLLAPLATAPILQAVAVEKDVDGFNWRNLGALVDGHPGFVPCTPLGVIALLDHAGIEIEGRHAIVVGRSSIVGKPLAMLLLARNATVTICHSRTRDLAEITAGGDIVVAAVGRAGLITGHMIKQGAAVIDVGINRLPGGKLAGDVDFESARRVAGWLTPVPGGVGPMTVAMLIANTLAAAERRS
jgi:methylenetetrahydrofolate dehydrogenase (NADP+)/methenyltetrahydrofolate cyclohydrolase